MIARPENVQSRLIRLIEKILMKYYLAIESCFLLKHMSVLKETKDLVVYFFLEINVVRRQGTWKCAREYKRCEKRGWW